MSPILTPSYCGISLRFSDGIFCSSEGFWLLSQSFSISVVFYYLAYQCPWSDHWQQRGPFLEEHSLSKTLRCFAKSFLENVPARPKVRNLSPQLKSSISCHMTSSDCQLQGKVLEFLWQSHDTSTEIESERGNENSAFNTFTFTFPRIQTASL